MNRKKDFPEGYMTVGQAAKKMGVTVRALQYYDKEGLLCPCAQSEGGRRLYTDRELIRLHQILSLKSLGFSLEEIKNKLIPLQTPEEVASALSEQAAVLREKIAGLTQSLRDTEALQAEVLQMQTVDFKKYADIIVNLQMNNANYRLIKYFSEKTLDHIRSRFTKESGLAFIRRFGVLQQTAVSLLEQGEAPDSEVGIRLAEVFWKLIEEFTGGDLSMLPELMAFSDSDMPDSDWSQQQKRAQSFLSPALEAYFLRSGNNPFEEEQS